MNPASSSPMNLTERLRQRLGVIWAVVPYCLFLTVGFADANESSLADEEALTDLHTEEADAIPVASAGDSSENPESSDSCGDFRSPFLSL